MKATFNYANDTGQINGIKFEIDDLRRWLTDNHTQIVLSHRVKRIMKSTGWEWTYDWDGVLYKINNSYIIKQYYDRISKG
jgi:hypothetical protein